MSESREQWAEDHGYYHWKCSKCGMSGWTDTHPDCACRCSECGKLDCDGHTEESEDES